MWELKDKMFPQGILPSGQSIKELKNYNEVRARR